jgi:chaperonin cofactor prefoldin
MAEAHVISAIKAKEEEIKRRIVSLKREIKDSQEDLETVRKTLRIFEPENRNGGNRLFRR